ncbi:hypothetical protein [Persicobacter sp. CCB-QB2]|uniref:hypothetical protein n=1 Tax=Persicobacter sp. CCB-QB2 TaxID=1561025 RepID=UPI0006A98F9D|nr:hypothetical protein [Persicobacter sp. CCB-QB2]
MQRFTQLLLKFSFALAIVFSLAYDALQQIDHVKVELKVQKALAYHCPDTPWADVNVGKIKAEMVNPIAMASQFFQFNALDLKIYDFLGHQLVLKTYVNHPGFQPDPCEAYFHTKSIRLECPDPCQEGSIFNYAVVYS